jgi:hypothetical protein
MYKNFKKAKKMYKNFKQRKKKCTKILKKQKKIYKNFKLMKKRLQEISTLKKFAMKKLIVLIHFSLPFPNCHSQTSDSDRRVQSGQKCTMNDPLYYFW